MVCSKEGAEVVPKSPWRIGQMSVLLSHLRLFPVLLVGICFRQPNGNRHWTDPVPNLPNRLTRSGILQFQFDDRILWDIH